MNEEMLYRISWILHIVHLELRQLLSLDQNGNLYYRFTQ